MIEAITLGIIQGITEWLPISSEGAITFVKIYFFKDTGLFDIIRFALFLHLGTLLAATIYFWKDIAKLIRGISSPASWRSADKEMKQFVIFLLVSTLISGGLGAMLLGAISFFEDTIELSAKIVLIALGIFLFGTAYIHRRGVGKEERSIESLNLKDALYAGIAQGLAALPGFSRSGLTVAVLLFSNIKTVDALKISFIMSIPIVFAGNIVLNWTYITSWNITLFIALLASFVLGIATIHAFIKIAERISFSFFTIAFGTLVIISALFI